MHFWRFVGRVLRWVGIYLWCGVVELVNAIIGEFGRWVWRMFRRLFRAIIPWAVMLGTLMGLEYAGLLSTVFAVVVPYASVAITAWLAWAVVRKALRAMFPGGRR